MPPRRARGLRSSSITLPPRNVDEEEGDNITLSEPDVDEEVDLSAFPGLEVDDVKAQPIDDFPPQTSSFRYRKGRASSVKGGADDVRGEVQVTGEEGASGFGLVVPSNVESSAKTPRRWILVGYILPKKNYGRRAGGFTRDAAIKFMRTQNQNPNFRDRIGPLENKGTWFFQQRPVFKSVRKEGNYYQRNWDVPSNPVAKRLVFTYPVTGNKRGKHKTNNNNKKEKGKGKGKGKGKNTQKRSSPPNEESSQEGGVSEEKEGKEEKERKRKPRESERQKQKRQQQENKEQKTQRSKSKPKSKPKPRSTTSTNSGMLLRSGTRVRK